MSDVDDESFAIDVVRREAVLSALTDGPRERADLGEALDLSKSTLHRIATRMGELGVLEETDEGLALTPEGIVIAREVERFTDRVATARQLGPLLNNIDADALPVSLDIDLLQKGTVTLPKPGQPQRPVQRVVDFVEASDEVRGFGPVLLPIYVQVFHREILDGMETVLVLEEPVAMGLMEEYPEKLEEAVATGRVGFALHDELPFGLLVSDERVALIGYDDEDVARVFVESDDPDFYDWGRNVFETVHDAADPVELDGFVPDGDG